MDMFCVGQVDEVAHQIDLADFRQRRRCVGQRGGRQQIPSAVRHVAFRQAMRAPAGWLISNSSSVDWFLSMNLLSTRSAGCGIAAAA